MVADLSDVLTATVIGEYNSSTDNCCAAPWRFIALGTTLFGSADTVFAAGNKGQSYDITSSTTQEGLDQPVAPEQSDAYELVIKSSLFDGRVQLNATAFYSKYEDFQATSTVADQSGNLAFKLNNVGALETQGLEVDAIAVLTENFRMNIGFAYIDATIESFEGADCYPLQTAAEDCVTVGGVSTQDLSGKDLSNSPDFKVTIGGKLWVPLEDMPFDCFVNFSYQWQDDVNFDLLQHRHGSGCLWYV